MQILEYEQHRCGGRAVREQLERVLEDSQLRARRLPVDLPGLPERAQGLDERLVGQLGADEIDRAPEEDLEPRVAGALAELGHEPGLADARFAGDEDGRAVSGARRIERALELPELACASDENLAAREPPFRPVSRDPGRAGAMSTRAHEDKPAGAKDKALRPMRSGSSMATIDSITTSRGGEQR